VALAGPPKHIEVPDPGEGEGEGVAPIIETPAPEGGTDAAPDPQAPDPQAPAQPVATASVANTSRRVQGVRKADGDAPANVFGRYHVAEITEAGETEDFRTKMDRAGRALEDDCIVVKMAFDFGPAPAEGATGHRPRSVHLAQAERCERGGLGTYAQELAVEVPATWAAADGAVTLALPAVTLLSDYVRLRLPADGDMRTPSQWLAPDASVELVETTWRIVAEPAGRRGELPVLHLSDGKVVMHLEADPGDGPFDAKQK
jgi:hypothetical protein